MTALPPSIGRTAVWNEIVRFGRDYENVETNLGEEIEIVDSLLDGVELQTLDRQVRVRVGEPVEPVLDDYNGTVLLLRDLAVDGLVCQITVVTWG